MQQPYFDANNYCNWANIPMAFYETGEYTYTVSGTSTYGTYYCDGSFYIYDITPVISGESQSLCKPLN